jgi:carbonic anhydrase
MDRLLAGYHRFRTNVWPTERALYESLATKGQSPETLVFACSDSRVDPKAVFDAVPGELFVVRNVAGLVPTYQPDSGYHGTSAALEYAVRVLKVARIVVLGHEQCGGVRAMVEGAPKEARDFVEPWMGMAKSVLLPPPDGIHDHDLLPHYEEEVVRLSVANLQTFPWVAERLAAGSLKIDGFRFGIESGVLTRMGKDGFGPVV